MTTQADLIITLKAYAQKNYNKGMDSFVECYDHADWVDFIAENGSEAKCKKMMRDLASIFQEREGY